MASHFVKIDNTDPRLVYLAVQQFGPFHGRGWSSAIGASDDAATQGPIFNNTLQVGPLLDISVAFTFEGIGVAVYGSVRPPLTYFAPLPESAYSLIGWDYAGIPAMERYKASNVTSPINNVHFWSKSGIPLKNYTLTINVTAATSDMPYYLDYIAIELPGPDPSVGSSTAASAPSSTSSTPTGTSDTLSVSASSTSGVPAPDTSVGQASNRSVHKGAIIGGTIGGVAVLALAILALLFWYKRRPKPSPEYGYGSVGQQDAPQHITPYVAPSDVGSMRQMGDGALMFVPGLPPASPSTSSRPQSPTSVPSQKILALGFAGRQGSVDFSGAGSSTVGTDRKDPGLFQNSSRPQTPAQGSEAGSSSGPSVARLAYSAPPVTASELRPRVEESPPAYTPS
ncbi:hypothetical protein BC628DRAFT_1422338 [Trametes gibbosa]|nr:hypothetical protein BC628DRAFT_1422338 [Trametes gibbosa]